ncbi:hypothetical protein LNQ03_27525 [Klebsiella pneumoniae subsp. pneumoniae]|nr:hypothetical protein [Klebsiella pneumoniae subsp. pneumoniae]
MLVGMPATMPRCCCEMMLNGMALPPRPESLILPALEGAAPKALGVAALPDSAPICSCHNVSKGDICQAVNNGAGDMSAIKAAPERLPAAAAAARW